MITKQLYARRILPTLLVCFVPVLQGCLAAAPFVIGAYYATTAFSVYKGVQLTTGGSAEIRFPKDVQAVSPGSDQELKSIKHIAVLPGNRMSTLLAQELEKKGLEVTTPYQIEKKFKESGNLTASSMTDTEKFREMKIIAKEFKADAILEFIESQGGTDWNVWSLNRAESRMDFTIRIVSSKGGKSIYNLQGQFVLKCGASAPSQKEIDNVFLEVVVEKMSPSLGR